ncbi:hypothetical protein BDW02DRAFT_536964 [Decorospora gaudefroyi]|uniref:DUF7730 domain-containing protein n=1 Tax=Decorospora gaudefroyi TaxID=184978 RepID=A0A6A5JY92_9PLEO|nr:hypothetical protein BDW02DRAFT_536964 [Decorospora gaudefroyi]
MSDLAAPAETFASGRYCKRKRTQITYRLEELDVSDSESDFESPQAKKPKAKIVSRRLPKRKIFPFMALPAEIRDIIYGYALTDPSGIHLFATIKNRRRTTERVSAACHSAVFFKGGLAYIHINSKDRATYEARVPLNPSLLAVSKQIHQESVDILYGNELIFANSLALYAYMIHLPPASAQRLKRIRILGWGQGLRTTAYNHACFAVLRCATNIAALHIDAPIGSYRSPKGGSEQLYRDAFPWLEAVGTVKGRADAALDVLHLGEECLCEAGHLYQVLRPSRSHGERTLAFKEALRKLLETQQKRSMAPKSVVKKRKMAMGGVGDE